MKSNYYLIIVIAILFFSTSALSMSQAVTLNADGKNNTYELINQILASGKNAIECPDDNHHEFGRHITEIWDDDLKQYVFEFHIHLEHDNDNVTNDSTRQRIEIKTYEQSPNKLKGIQGEIVVYKWKFKIPTGFQPSFQFTHLHQIKPVGGSDENPLFTLTVNKGKNNSPDKIYLVYNNTKVDSANLSLFENTWVEATERIKIDKTHGTYSMNIINLHSMAPIMSYSNNELMTIRSTNDFIRPKWGIYRSIINKSVLRDETVRFNSFSINEEVSSISMPDNQTNNNDYLNILTNSTSKNIDIEYLLEKTSNINISILNLNGQIVKNIIRDEIQLAGKYKQTIDLSEFSTGIYFIQYIANDFFDTRKFYIRTQSGAY